MRQHVNRDRHPVRKRGNAVGRRVRTVTCHVEQLEPRAVLSAESTFLLPPPTGMSDVANAAHAVLAPLSPIAPVSPISPPVVAARLRLTMPAEVRAGVPTLITATALDAAGRPVTSFNGTATVASSDDGASLPLVEVSFKNGRASFTVTFATAGRQSVRVTSLDDPAITARASTSVRAAAVAVAFSVTLPRSAAVGVPVFATIVAVDARGRPVPTFSGTATLSSSDAAAKLPSSVRFTAGRAVVRVTFGTLGAQTLTAFRVWSGPDGAIHGSGTTQVAEVVSLRIRALPTLRP